MGLNVEHLFLAGIGFDIGGAYLVSRGLLAGVPQLARAGGTIYALEQPRAVYQVEDRTRGSAGLCALVLGFVIQALGYTLVLNRAPVEYGRREVWAGVLVAAVCAAAFPAVERLSRPRRRRRILIDVARFDYETGEGQRDKPVANVLRLFGEDLGHEQRAGEDDVAYCARVWDVEAEEPGA